ncbi:unnamed protein product, partial [Rotaria sp. Silwood2]
MDVTSTEKIDDVIIGTQFSLLRWSTDNRGIFYVTYAGAFDNITSNNDSTTSKEKWKKTQKDTENKDE